MVGPVENNQTQFDVSDFDIQGLPSQVGELIEYLSQSDVAGLEGSVDALLDKMQKIDAKNDNFFASLRGVTNDRELATISEKLTQLLDIIDDPGVMKEALQLANGKGGASKNAAQFLKSLPDKVSDETKFQVENLVDDLVKLMPRSLEQDAMAIVGAVANNSFAKGEEIAQQQNTSTHNPMLDITYINPLILSGPSMLNMTHPAMESFISRHENGFMQMADGFGQSVLGTLQQARDINPAAVDSLSFFTDRLENAVARGDKPQEDALGQLIMGMLLDAQRDSEGRSGIGESGSSDGSQSCGRSSGGRGGGSIFEVLAAALGKIMGDKLDDLREKADAVAQASGSDDSNEFGTATTQFTAANTEFQLINTTIQTAFAGLGSIKNAAQGR